MDITEQSRIKHGTITVDGRKQLYTMVISPHYGSEVERIHSIPAVKNDVTLIVHSKQGTIIDTMERTYDRGKLSHMVDVVKAALAEFQSDRQPETGEQFSISYRDGSGQWKFISHPKRFWEARRWPSRELAESHAAAMQKQAPGFFKFKILKSAA